ncbi:MAG: SAF domain-containing protein [Micrococcales bacterium]|nr:SAF domain-containing protein [Micrococcales bacterium]
MTTTATRPAVPGAGPERAALVPLPPKPRRRWGLFAAGVLVACLGILGSVWFYQSATKAVPVVAAARNIERGAVLERDDLVVVRVEKDPLLSTVPGDGLDSLLGQRALFDVAEGSILTPKTVGEKSEPGEGRSLVAVPVSASMVPTGLVAGDDVRFVPVGSGSSDAGEPVAAKVVEVRAGSSSSGSAKVVVEVTVPEGSAVALASMSGKDVAVVLESRDR